MVADDICRDWFSKFRIPAQIHTNGGKEFINKPSEELFQLLNVSHTKTSPAHPSASPMQCPSGSFQQNSEKNFSNLSWMTLHLIGKPFYRHWPLVITQVIIQQSQLCRLNYSLEKKPDCRLSQTKIFSKFTTLKLQGRKGLTFCKDSGLKRTNLPLNTD